MVHSTWTTHHASNGAGGFKIRIFFLQEYTKELIQQILFAQERYWSM